MAEQHQALLILFRKKLVEKGFREFKNPMPTYRPDIFCKKSLRSGKVLEEIVVEVEIENTLFLEHTAIQLVLMDEYLNHMNRKKKKVNGYLLVPNKKSVKRLAASLVESLFPLGCKIRVI